MSQNFSALDPPVKVSSHANAKSWLIILRWKILIGRKAGWKVGMYT